MSSVHLNPWLKKAIMELREQASDKMLRTRYDITRQRESGLSWEDFLWDLALQRQLDRNPMLKTRTDDMPLSPHVKDILKANFIDALVLLVQMTADELHKVPGLKGIELEEIDSYLESVGITLAIGEEGTLKQAWEGCLEERRGDLQILESFKERRKVVREDPKLSLNEMVGMVCQEKKEYTAAVPYYRRAVSILERGNNKKLKI